jgi:hypothetical protein
LVRAGLVTAMAERTFAAGRKAEDEPDLELWQALEAVDREYQRRAEKAEIQV